MQAIYFGVDRATRGEDSWGLGPRIQSAIEIAGFDFFNWIWQLSIIKLRYRLKEEKKNNKVKQKSEVVAAKSLKIIPVREETFSSDESQELVGDELEVEDLEQDEVVSEDDDNDDSKDNKKKA